MNTILKGVKKTMENQYVDDWSQQLVQQYLHATLRTDMAFKIKKIAHIDTQFISATDERRLNSNSIFCNIWCQAQGTWT